MEQSETIITQDMSAGTAAPKTFWKKWGIWIIAVIILIAIIGALIWFNILPFNFNGVSKYQAVFLANGQVYFGKIAGEKEDYMKLASIYYLQVQQSVQPAATAKDDKGNPITQPQPAPQQNIQLVKLGSELHGPEDIMYIAKNQILFYEDLKTDSRVVQAIKAFEKK